jgi:hypothetical protein
MKEKSGQATPQFADSEILSSMLYLMGMVFLRIAEIHFTL